MTVIIYLFNYKTAIVKLFYFFLKDPQVVRKINRNK